jgi:hypothetical protein
MKMTYIFRTLILMAMYCISNTIHAQDVITKRDGIDIQAKIIEITPSEVKYKRYDNPEGPTYHILKGEVLMIRYENGTKDEFNLNNKPDESIGKVVNNDPANLIDVLKNGDISSIVIEGGDSTITITIDKIDKTKALNCIIPNGITKLGIIENGQIYSGDIKYTKIYTSAGTTFGISTSVKVNKFNSEGFSIELDKSIPISIPKDEVSIKITVKGKLKINVPSGYSFFLLSGLSGTIISGKIIVRKNTDEKAKQLFEIEYGNMTITR